MLKHPTILRKRLWIRRSLPMTGQSAENIQTQEKSAYIEAREGLLLHLVGRFLAHRQDGNAVASGSQVLGSPEPNDGVASAVGVHNQHLLLLPSRCSHAHRRPVPALAPAEAVPLCAPRQAKGPGEVRLRGKPRSVGAERQWWPRRPRASLQLSCRARRQDCDALRHRHVSRSSCLPCKLLRSNAAKWGATQQSGESKKARRARPKWNLRWLGGGWRNESQPQRQQPHGGPERLCPELLTWNGLHVVHSKRSAKFIRIDFSLAGVPSLPLMVSPYFTSHYRSNARRRGRLWVESRASTHTIALDGWGSVAFGIAFVLLSPRAFHVCQLRCPHWLSLLRNRRPLEATFDPAFEQYFIVWVLTSQSSYHTVLWLCLKWPFRIHCCTGILFGQCSQLNEHWLNTLSFG